MNILAHLRAALASWQENRGFDEGFHGATRRECKRIGLGAVRDRLKVPGLFNAAERTAAEAFVARSERREAWRHWGLLAMAAIAAAAAIANLVVK